MIQIPVPMPRKIKMQIDTMFILVCMISLVFQVEKIQVSLLDIKKQCIPVQNMVQK